jgi:MFS family permease
LTTGMAGTGTTLISRWPCGFYGVVIVCINTVITAVKSPSQANIFSFAIEPMAADLELSRASFSTLYGVATFTAALLQPFMGRMVDRHGARCVMPLTLAGLAVALAVQAGCAELPPVLVRPVIFVAWLGVRGCGFAINNIAATNINQWYSRYRGTAMSCSNIGAKMLEGVVVAQLYERSVAVNDWAGTQLVASAGCAAFALIAVVCIRHTPEQCGCTPDGLPLPGGKLPQSDSDRDDEEASLLGDASTDDEHDEKRRPAASDRAAAASIAVDMTLKEALRTRSLWILASNAFVLCTVMAGSDLHLMSILEEAQPGTVTSGIISISTMMLLPGTIAQSVFCFVFGRLFDAGLEPRYILTFAGCCAASYAQLLAAMSVAPSAWMGTLMIVAGAVKGLSSAGLTTCQGVVYATYFGRTHLGAISSIDKVGMVAGSAFGPLMFGVARTVFGEWPLFLRYYCLILLSLRG